MPPVTPTTISRALIRESHTVALRHKEQQKRKGKMMEGKIIKPLITLPSIILPCSVAVPMPLREMLQISQIQLHRLACPLEVAGDTDFLGGVEEDLVLGDFLQHHLHLVLGVEVDKGPASLVELHQPLLDERAQLEPAADLVDDGFFLQFFNHSFFPSRAR